MTPVRAVWIVGAVLCAPSLARAQTPPGESTRHVVLVSSAAARPASVSLAQALRELVAPYRADVTIRAEGDAPDADVTVTLHVTRERGGLRVSFERRPIDAAQARPSALALRVLTAIRGALERDDEDPLTPPEERVEVPVMSRTVPTRLARAEPESVEVHARRVAAPAPRRAPRLSTPTWFVEAGVAQWIPVGTGAFTGVSVRFGGRVGGTSRSGVWLGVEPMVLGARTLVLSGAPARVSQVPVVFDVSWSTRLGALTLALGGTFSALLTRIGVESVSSTLAFGAGVSAELGLRLGARVTLGLRGRGLCMGHTTVVREENATPSSIGPFFAAGEAVLRIGL